MYTPDNKKFDADLAMFRETPGPVNIGHLKFLRFLIESGKLVHPPINEPSGELAPQPANAESNSALVRAASQP
jgi:hypothetical protein